jgi:hypothetical protein
MTFYGRIGAFFFFIGFLALVVFFASSQARDPIYSYLCIGSLAFFGGIHMMWKYRSPPSLSDRFHSYRKYREGRNRKRESLEQSKFREGEERGNK